jgi:hypothetical protein
MATMLKFMRAITILLLVLNVGNQRAFFVLTSVAIIMFYIAYLCVTGPLLVARLRGKWPTAEHGPYFSLGRWGLLVNVLALAATAEVVELRPALVEKYGSIGVGYYSGGALVARSTEAAPAGVQLLLPGAEAKPVVLRTKTEHKGVIELGPAQMGPLTLRRRLVQKTPSLVERTLEVRADSPQRFSVWFPLEAQE